MDFQSPLVGGTLKRRYKRFLADVVLDSGETVTAHCPNPGAMTGLADEGTRIWLEPNDDPKKKLKYGWRLSQTPDGTLVCIDTMMTNKVVGESLGRAGIAELTPYDLVRSEVKFAQSSRVDFLLTEDKTPDHYVEVKAVSLCRRSGLAEFPDTRTDRGAKHLCALAEMAAMGKKATMLYVVMRTDCTSMALAGDIDPVYFAAAKEAKSAGVQVLVYAAKIDRHQITLGERLHFDE